MLFNLFDYIHSTWCFKELIMWSWDLQLLFLPQQKCFICVISWQRDWCLLLKHWLNLSKAQRTLINYMQPINYYNFLPINDTSIEVFISLLNNKQSNAPLKKWQNKVSRSSVIFISCWCFKLWLIHGTELSLFLNLFVTKIYKTASYCSSNVTGCLLHELAKKHMQFFPRGVISNAKVCLDYDFWD